MKTNKKAFTFVHVDMNNSPIKYGDTVRVPEPLPDDLWNHEFAGAAIDAKENGEITVQDGDGDCFEIFSHIVEKVITDDDMELANEAEEVELLKDEKNGLYPDRIDIAN